MSAAVVEALAALGFKSSREQVLAILAHATKSRLSPLETVQLVTEGERRARDACNLAYRTKRAALGAPKPMADFEWDYPRAIDRTLYDELATLACIRQRENILLRGPSGVGKTMIGQNIGLLAINAGMTVVFTNTAAMLADLLRQSSVPAIERRIRRYTNVDLLVCDELGYVPAVETREVDLFYQVLSRRHGKASTLITTNLPFKAWGNVFPGASCLVALIDRFTEHLHVLDIDGDSYRQKGRTVDDALPAATARLASSSDRPRKKTRSR